jgi:hypothetical protein
MHVVSSISSRNWAKLNIPKGFTFLQNKWTKKMNFTDRNILLIYAERITMGKKN